MKIDVSIIVRVVYKPRHVFEEFVRRPHFEALLPVMVVVILTTIRGYLDLPQREAAGALGVVVGLLAAFAYVTILMIIQPLLNAMCVFVLRGLIVGNANIGFLNLFTALILCALPMYLGFLLESLSAVFQFRLVDMYRSLSETHPFLFGMLSTLTPYFLGTIVLWWIALTALLRVEVYRRLVLVASLSLLDMVIGGVLGEALAKFLTPPRTSSP